MACSFNNDSYIYHNTPGSAFNQAGGSTIHSISVWLYLDGIGAADWEEPVFYTGESDASDGWGVTFGANDNITVYTEGANTGTQGSFSTGAWFHLCVIFNQTDNDIYIYKNGIEAYSDLNYTDDSTSADPILRIGTDDNINEYFDGKMAEFAFYNVHLTPAEVVSLAMGLSPLLVRRGNLVFYAPLTYRSQDFDIVGNLNMTAYNSPSWAEHPSGLTYPEPAHPMIKEQLPYFWTLPIAEEEPEALSVQLDTLSAVFSAEAIAVSGGTEFPFSDDFTGSNNDPWNSTKWTAVAG